MAIGPKFAKGDWVKVKYWPSQPALKIGEIIFDGLGVYYDLIGGGTFGEGALVAAAPEEAAQEPAHGQ